MLFGIPLWGQNQFSKSNNQLLSLYSYILSTVGRFISRFAHLAAQKVFHFPVNHAPKVFRFPVKGVSFPGKGVSFPGIPFDLLSTASDATLNTEEAPTADN